MVNYYQDFLKITKDIENGGVKKRLLLHSCCAPCSSASLEKLLPFFDITIYFYNPNITEIEEYNLRLKEQRRFISQAYTREIEVIDGGFNSDVFFNLARGLEQEPERGKRCFACYEERLLKTALLCKERGFDYFATTLTLSPHKNSQKLNEIGFMLEDKFKVNYLPTDLKKGGGYIRSIELSKKYNLYRQNYCGCIFSKG